MALFNLNFLGILLYIIILRVSFCSDIWYCNILAYYLDNELDTKYNNDINVVLSR
jgi:hypothetical protein